MTSSIDFASDMPTSLSQLFQPPDGHSGVFGWVLGYSADTHFIDAAAERFTGRTRAGRSSGHIALAFILEEHNDLRAADMPGALHLKLKGKPPFAKLHAKVALLLFRGADPEAWRIRLVVSTGNWTRQCEEDSIDMAGVVEFGEPEIGEATADRALRAADITAAHSLLAYVRNLADDSALVRSAVTRNAIEQFENRMRQIADVDVGLTPRFADNRGKSLLDAMVARVGQRRHRNVLVLGSGFYEGGDRASVIHSIVGRLKDEGAVNRGAEVYLIVNPQSCQAVAADPANAAWTIYPPGSSRMEREPKRALHAKFVFGAKEKPKSDLCRFAWLFFGSGNLTRPGFLLAANGAGNLEAAIMIHPEELWWFGDNRYGEGVYNYSTTRLLPMDWGEPCKPVTLARGEPMPDPGDPVYAPPVPFLEWRACGGGVGVLRSPQEPDEPIDVIGRDERPCAVRDGAFVWEDDHQPEDVTIRWARGAQSAIVPVLDTEGRIGRRASHAIDFQEAMALLSGFPNPPDDTVDDGDDDDDGEGRPPGNRPGGSSEASAPSSIRMMMQLIERIASQQKVISKYDWVPWCERLRDTLVRMKDRDEIAAFTSLGLNPLSPLRHAPFRPDWAGGDTAEAELYDRTLRDVAAAWDVERLAPLEGDL